jgi:hypothetical protein
MIKLQLDEAFCFDLLSISEVKYNKTKNVTAFNNFLQIKSEISNQINENTLSTIIHSTEYKELLNCNEKIFDLVDEIKINYKLPAYIVDNLNYKRFELKKALQEKFFQKSLIKEEKFGYK